MIAEYLGRHGFAVRTAADARELDAQLAGDFPDLLILDINMPGEDGLSVARRLRIRSQVPILMLTAADDVIDRVVGLEVGADDYLTKPFDLRELRARVRALLRRATTPVAESPASTSVPPPAVLESPSRIRFGRLLLDLDAQRLIAPDGSEQSLTAMEFDLLAAFARNPNRVLSRDRLLDLAHNRSSEAFDRSIDIRVARIRRKVEADPAKPQVIKTVRGAGYMFAPARP
jgi:two-component system phosphate regulon response regulator OmpR